MSDECHAVLKAYAAFFKLTMGEVLFMFARQEIQQHAQNCTFVEGLLTGQGITLDKRVSKACWGHSCLICNHTAKCQAGLTKETFIPIEYLKKFLTNNSPVWDLYDS